MLHAPAIANHITVRWAGDLVNAITTGKGIYQWGNELPLTSQQHWTLIAMLPFVWVINMLLLPFVAMYPPLADMLRSLLQDNFGVLGVESRDPNSETRKKGVIGYSPYFCLWWRSFILFDVPLFKYAMAQIGCLRFPRSVS